jgi:diguanylate cyclase
LSRARWTGRVLTVLLAVFLAIIAAVLLARGKALFLLVAAVVSFRLVGKFEPGTPSRTAWQLLSAGLAAMFLGQACFVVYQFALGIEVPFPSLADVFFLVSYPLLIGALAMFLRAYSASGFPLGPASERLWLAVGVALFCAVVAYPILKPLVAKPGEPLETLLNLLYPVLDFLLLIPTVLLIRISLRFRGGAVWKVWVRLLGGFLFLCAADILFAYFSQFDWVELTDLVDATYLLAYGFLGLGVLYQRDLLD